MKTDKEKVIEDIEVFGLGVSIDGKHIPIEDIPDWLAKKIYGDVNKPRSQGDGAVEITQQ